MLNDTSSVIHLEGMPKRRIKHKLVLRDGTVFNGFSFGFPASVYGEVVFQTGMVGYVESLTDPSYAGQILVPTYPLIGNYGVPDASLFESDKIRVRGLVVSEYSEKFSHAQAKKSLANWLLENKVPAIYGVDTRALTKKLREKEVMLGKIIIDKNIKDFYDPNKKNLVADVSCKNGSIHGNGKTKIILIDCGMKNNILRCLLDRGLTVKRVPWDYNFLNEKFDGVVISNGPGDPTKCAATISNIRKLMERSVPILGICLGTQILALAAGAKTYKLKYGHRSQNQPVMQLNKVNKGGCFITSQNHGYAIDEKSLPRDWRVWFRNLNDNTIEGIIHKRQRWFSVQFHPESSPGPKDTEWLFDKFVETL